MRLRRCPSPAPWLKARAQHLARFARAREGNIAMTFAIVSVPMLIGVGASIDYVRAYNVRSRMQADLDAALIASIKKIDTSNKKDLRAEINAWFASQTELSNASYSLPKSSIKIDKANGQISAEAVGKVETLFMGLANIPSIDVRVHSTVAGPATAYMNLYVALDKSASMMLAATKDGQQQMKAYAESGCVFACHTPEGDSKPYKGTVYTTNYDLAEAMGVQLRTDVAIKATDSVLSLVSAADPTESRIKVGLYSIGSDANKVLEPTLSINTVQKYLVDDKKGLTSATSQPTTYFNTSFASLAKMVGTAGDGTSSGKPMKLALILTDGVQSERWWVTSNDGSNDNTTPLNPAWCAAMKDAGVTVGILYTQYLEMSWDWGYKRTLMKTMNSSKYKSMWGGDLVSGTSGHTSRQDYIPVALQECASSKDMFISAADPDEIEAGLSTLLQQYLSSVRLIN